MTKKQAIEEFWKLYPLGSISKNISEEGAILDCISRSIERRERKILWESFVKKLYNRGQITLRQLSTWKNPFVQGKRK